MAGAIMKKQVTEQELIQIANVRLATMQEYEEGSKFTLQ
jgi:hypothetical protein